MRLLRCIQRGVLVWTSSPLDTQTRRTVVLRRISLVHGIMQAFGNGLPQPLTLCEGRCLAAGGHERKEAREKFI